MLVYETNLEWYVKTQNHPKTAFNNQMKGPFPSRPEPVAKFVLVNDKDMTYTTFRAGNEEFTLYKSPDIEYFLHPDDAKRLNDDHGYAYVWTGTAYEEIRHPEAWYVTEIPLNQPQ